MSACKRNMNMDETYNDQTLQIMQRVLTNQAVGIDVGAYHGDILIDMVRLAPDGKHHAFEPQPEAARHLRERFQSKNVTIHELALSDRSGTTQFHQVSSNPSYSGIKERLYEKKEQVKMIDVRVETMDKVLGDLARIDLIKVDVEGGEYGVLSGGRQILAKYKPVVVFEHGRGAAEYYGTKPQQIYDLLVTKSGLNINLMSRALEGKSPLSKEQFVEQFEKKLNYYFVAYPDQSAGLLSGTPAKAQP